MAVSIFVPGLIAVHVATPGNPSEFTLLGYTRDGVHIREEARMVPIYGEEGGGPEGVPVDIRYLGEYHEVRAELYKYDGDQITKVLNRLSPTAAKARGKVLDPGWMIRSAGDHFILKLVSEIRYQQNVAPPFVRVYPVAIPMAPIEYPVGTREMVTLVQFTCFPASDGTIFTVPQS